MEEVEASLRQMLVEAVGIEDVMVGCRVDEIEGHKSVGFNVAGKIEIVR